ERNGGPLYATSKQWAPRFGFAWTPRGQTDMVIKGGYGMFYTLDSMNLTGIYSLIPYFLTQRFQSSFAANANLANNPTFTNPWPGGTAISGTINEIGIQKDYKNARFQHFNLDIQRQMPLG